MVKSCEDCRFFDAGNIVCMYDARTECVLDEEKKAKECPYYDRGKYSMAELEKTDYK